MAQRQASERGLGSLILRGIWVLVAFALSALVGLVLLLVIGSMATVERMSDAVPGDVASDFDAMFQNFELLVGSFEFVVTVVPILTVLPALAVVLIGEVTRIRGLLFYVVGGGLAVVALPVLASPAGTAFNGQALAGFATAGFAGGFVYWLLAGRRA